MLFRSALEVVFFLGRQLKHPRVRKAAASSKTKTYHVVHVAHRDEVEAPLTDWLQEAYEFAAPEAVRVAPGGRKKAR